MQYFKHFTKMRTDPKIRRLFARFGLEGYGLYNLILESIAEGIDTENPLPFLEETCDDIALFYNCNSAKVDEMVRYMLENGLLSIETTEKRIACYKIYKYLEQSQTRSEKIRELITAYKDSREMLVVSDCLRLSETNMIEENRQEQTKKRIIKEFTPPTLEQVESYVLEKQLVINPYKFIDWYSKTDWKDNEGKQIKNWKMKAINWDSREKEKNPSAIPYSKPLPLQEQVPREKKKCPKCGGDIRGSACVLCYTNYDYNGDEI